MKCFEKLQVNGVNASLGQPSGPDKWRGLGSGLRRLVVWQFCIHTSTAGEAVTMITRCLAHRTKRRRHPCCYPFFGRLCLAASHDFENHMIWHACCRSACFFRFLTRWFSDRMVGKLVGAATLCKLSTTTLRWWTQSWVSRLDVGALKVWQKS